MGMRTMDYDSHPAALNSKEDKTLSPTLYAHSIVFSTIIVFLAHLRPLSKKRSLRGGMREGSPGLSEFTNELEIDKACRQNAFSQRQL